MRGGDLLLGCGDLPRHSQWLRLQKLLLLETVSSGLSQYLLLRSVDQIVKRLVLNIFDFLIFLFEHAQQVAALVGVLFLLMDLFMQLLLHRLYLVILFRLDLGNFRIHIIHDLRVFQLLRLYDLRQLLLFDLNLLDLLLVLLVDFLQLQMLILLQILHLQLVLQLHLRVFLAGVFQLRLVQPGLVLQTLDHVILLLVTRFQLLDLLLLQFENLLHVICFLLLLFGHHIFLRFDLLHDLFEVLEV